MPSPEDIAREIAMQKAAAARKEGACPTCQQTDRVIVALKPGEMKCKRCDTTWPRVISVVPKPKGKKGPLPRYLRRAYRYKNKEQINREIEKAIAEGFTKAQILADFKKWQETQEFIE